MCKQQMVEVAGQQSAKRVLEALLGCTGVVAEQPVGEEAERLAMAGQSVGEGDRALRDGDVQRVLVGTELADVDRRDPGRDLVARGVTLRVEAVASSPSSGTR